MQPPTAIQDVGRALAEQPGGYFLDHLADATRAVFGCGLPAIAEEIFDQVARGGRTRCPSGSWPAREPAPPPQSSVVTCGAMDIPPGWPWWTRRGPPTSYFPAWASGCSDYTTGTPSRIPGIGRPRTEAGFLPEVIDLVIPVPNAASVAALRWLRTAGEITAGPATDTNVWGVCRLVARMRATGQHGSVGTIIGDRADPYRDTRLDEAWISEQGVDPRPYAARLERFAHTGEWSP